MGPLCRGPVWMPITPKRGVFLHADSQPDRDELSAVAAAHAGYRPFQACLDSTAVATTRKTKKLR